MRITEPYTIYPRKLSSGKTVYYYQFRYDDGRRSTAKSTGCDTLPKAKRFVQKLYNQGQFETGSKILFSNFVAGFFDDDSDYVQWRFANGNGIKPETLRAYNKALNNQLLPFYSSYQLCKITTDVVKKWVVWCSKQWSNKTINNAQGVLNIIFESAIDKELITHSPLRTINFRRTTKKERVLLTVQELNLIYHAEWTSDIHRQMFLLVCVTGMRIGEASALTIDSVHDGYVYVTKTYSDRYGLGTTKTGINRYVPVPAEYHYPSSCSNWIFDGKNGKPLLSHTIYNGLTRICEKLGIDCKSRGITVHSLRNFFISYLQKANVPLEKIKAVVGHADTNMTEHYTYWTPDAFNEVLKIQSELLDKIIGE